MGIHRIFFLFWDSEQDGVGRNIVEKGKRIFHFSFSESILDRQGSILYDYALIFEIFHVFFGLFDTAFLDKCGLTEYNGFKEYRNIIEIENKQANCTDVEARLIGRLQRWILDEIKFVWENFW